MQLLIRLLNKRRSDFCWLNILLLLNERYSQGQNSILETFHSAKSSRALGNWTIYWLCFYTAVYVKPSIKFFLNFQENNNFNVNTYSFKFIHTSVKLVMFKQTPKHNYKIYNRTCLLKIRHVFLDYWIFIMVAYTFTCRIIDVHADCR